VALCNDTSAGISPTGGEGGAQLGEVRAILAAAARDDVEECGVWHEHQRHVSGVTEYRPTSPTKPTHVNRNGHPLRLQQTCMEDRQHRPHCPTDWTSSEGWLSAADPRLRLVCSRVLLAEYLAEL
jgi:hypothetical protein